jgi:hypothetical protein
MKGILKMAENKETKRKIIEISSGSILFYKGLTLGQCLEIVSILEPHGYKLPTFARIEEGEEIVIRSRTISDLSGGEVE